MVIGKGIAVLLPVVLDLVRDGGGVFLDELGTGLEGHALPRQSSITLRSSKVRCLFFLGFDFLAICVASFLRNNFPDSIQPQMTYQSKSHFKSHCGTYFGNLQRIFSFYTAARSLDKNVSAWYNNYNLILKTVEVKIKTRMLLQRARGAESRVENKLLNGSRRARSKASPWMLSIPRRGGIRQLPGIC